MKLLKKNKSLCFLLIIATIYVLVTLLYINPLRAKNTKLEEKRNEILTLRQEDDSIQVFSEKEKVAEDTVDAMIFDDAEIISIYYGADASEEKAEELAAALEEKYPDCEVEINYGGQPIYYYIISVE